MTESITTKTCKGCALEIPEAARICPHCRTRYWSLGERIGVVLVAALIGLIVGLVITNQITSSAEREADDRIDEILNR
jgi:hypothetical protein